MHPSAFGHHRYYTRRRAALEGEQEFRDILTMGERQSHSPPRVPRTDDDEARDFFRAMATGQQEIVSLYEH